MATERKTIGSEQGRAFGHLERMTEFWRRSEDSSRTAARIAATTGSRWQIPERVSSARYVPGSDANSCADGRTRSDGLQSQSDSGKTERLIHRFAAVERALKAVARATGASKRHPIARGLSLAMTVLPRVERSVESGKAAGAIFRASQRAIRGAGSNPVSALRSESDSARRSRGNPGGRRGLLAGTAFVASARKASSMRGLVAPPSLSQRAFARLSGNEGGLSNNGGHTGVTINSSPTVVINASAAGGNLQRDVIGALRAHREELFDQLRRESARRERAQF
jgi:hypothetical protein